MTPGHDPPAGNWLSDGAAGGDNPSVAWINERKLSDLESRQLACAARWQLTLGATLTGGYRSRVFECVTRAGGEVVLKLTPTLEEALAEARALQVWEGTGASVKLLDVDPEAGALLLERLRPATPLSVAEESLVLDIVADRLARLHSVGRVDGFSDLADYLPHLAQRSVDDNAYERQDRGEPDRAAVAMDLIGAATETARQLCSTAARRVLLHGDLLDKNLLRQGDRYLAVDPIPRIGEPESELGFYACDHPPVSETMARAVELAGRLGADPARAARWAAVWTVLKAAEAWRDDQAELDALVASSEFQDILRG